MEKIKQLIIGLFVIVFNIYLFLALLVFTPLYNWKYANQHGLLRWVFFGEIISTGKALLFPFFIFDNTPEITESASMNSRQFYLALELSQKATKLINKSEKMVIQEEVDNIVLHEAQALEIGREVDIEALNQEYPELGNNFEKMFLSGLSLYVEGVGAQNPGMMVEGQGLKTEWDNWYVEYLDEINNNLGTT